MFRQDRTNPSTAVSTWKGRKDLPKANPSTAVSGWMNGGLGDSFTAITATGGTTSDFTYSGVLYRKHVFNSSGTFQITANPDGHTFDVLQYGGGGGRASGNRAGGGGGGGEMDTESVAGTVESFTVTIGAGAQVGGLTSFKGASWTDTFWARGGGHVEGEAPSYHGGAAAGNSLTQAATPSPTYAQGFAGGSSSGGNGGGGGGGSTAVGGSTTTNQGATGGAGSYHTEYGDSNGRGGGGGGAQGCVSGYSPGIGYGSTYGGGNGGWSLWAPNGGSHGGDGAANRGGGAGGNGCNMPNQAANGGSGIVVVRYALEAV